jgi:hypothetical protein
VIEGKDRQTTKGQVSEQAGEKRMVVQEQETTGVESAYSGPCLGELAA